jgi:hypothetical protein
MDWVLALNPASAAAGIMYCGERLCASSSLPGRDMRSPIRRHLAAASLIALLVPATASAASLSERSAVHALRANLARGYGIHHVHASCSRKTRSKLSCSWRGRRADGGYRGRATITRAGKSTLVQLSGVRRA